MANKPEQNPHGYACGGIIYYPELFKPECCCIFKNIARIIPLMDGSISLKNGETIVHLSGDNIEKIVLAIRKIAEKNNDQKKAESHS